jgi:hypothetical protein
MYILYKYLKKNKKKQRTEHCNEQNKTKQEKILSNSARMKIFRFETNRDSQAQTKTYLIFL